MTHIDDLGNERRLCAGVDSTSEALAPKQKIDASHVVEEIPPHTNTDNETADELAVLRKLAGALTVYRDAESGAFIVSREVLLKFNMSLDKTLWTREELSSMIHKDDFDALRQQLTGAIGSGSAVDAEFRLRLPSGEVRWIRCHSVLRLSDHAGKLPTFWAIQDITAYKFAMSDLRHRLEISNRRLLQANQSLAGFAYALSHDLKRPIRHVRSYCDLLSDAIAQGDQRAQQDYLLSLKSAALGMSDLIDKMLSFSHVGSRALELERIDHHAMISELMEGVVAHSQYTDLNWKFRGDYSEVVADRVLWRTLWGNLIDNAVKYSRFSKPISLAFECSRVKGGVRCQVTDNGIGFDLNACGALFEVFQRLTSDARFEGHGIGLAHVKRIVEAHGGTIMATSTLGQGATFCVIVPSD